MQILDFLIRKKEEVVKAVIPRPDAQGENWWYRHGESSICLVAHVDTIEPQTRNPIHEQGIWQSNDGLVLGADDRAGCYALYKLGQKHKDVNLLLLDGEECGGIGAKEFIESPPDIAHIKLFIEFDRRGYMEFVEYHPQPKWIRRLFEAAGFRKSYGTFSDVAILSLLGIPHANVSAGFLYEHTSQEILVEEFLEASIRAIDKILSIRR